ncbi:MAG: SpoVK/Ycf46/Vps4 family AAA+-type ATPase [Marinomonas primoryensis]|jgi:SpoVK/Ycf46/Vps4 family AAA+-type ATPase
MPTVENVLDIFEALSRKDWAEIKSVAESISEYERKKKHFNAAAKIKEAADLVISNNTSTDVFTMSDNMVTAPPMDLLERGSRISESPILPLWLSEEVERLTKEWKHLELLKQEGISPRNTILLHGPPGCGKTMLAKYLASTLERDIYTVRFDALVSSYLGETGENIRKIFSFAKTNRCVLFLDELDAIGKLRDDKSELGELKRVVVSLLQNIDDLHQDTILIAATNHAHMLDSAIWRRFDMVLELLPPKDDVREEFLKGELGQEFKSLSTKKLILQLTSGMSGADISRALKDSKRRRLLENKDSLEAFLLALLEYTKRSEENNSAFSFEERLIQVVAGLKSIYKKQYTYSKLEALTGIPHSTLHHKLKNN